MALEISFDPVAELVESGLLMGPEHEVLEDGEWISGLKRFLGRDDLFVYHHRWTGNFVLCQWLCHEPRACVELEIMHAPPDQGGGMDYKVLSHCVRPVAEVNREMRNRMKKIKQRKRDLQQQRGLERQDKARHLRRRGYAAEAAMLEHGGGPFVGEEEGGESLDMMKEDLARMIKVM